VAPLSESVMNDVLAESVVESLSLALTALLSGVLTVAGLLIERAGLQELILGNTVLGLWELGMGSIPLIVGVYLMGYQRLWPELRDRGAAE
jgi:hypothetical protein